MPSTLDQNLVQDMPPSSRIRVPVCVLVKPFREIDVGLRQTEEKLVGQALGKAVVQDASSYGLFDAPRYQQIPSGVVRLEPRRQPVRTERRADRAKIDVADWTSRESDLD